MLYYKLRLVLVLPEVDPAPGDADRRAGGAAGGGGRRTAGGGGGGDGLDGGHNHLPGGRVQGSNTLPGAGRWVRVLQAARAGSAQADLEKI